MDDLYQRSTILKKGSELMAQRTMVTESVVYIQTTLTKYLLDSKLQPHKPAEREFYQGSKPFRSTLLANYYFKKQKKLYKIDTANIPYNDIYLLIINNLKFSIQKLLHQLITNKVISL